MHGLNFSCIPSPLPFFPLYPSWELELEERPRTYSYESPAVSQPRFAAPSPCTCALLSFLLRRSVGVGRGVRFWKWFPGQLPAPRIGNINGPDLIGSLSFFREKNVVLY
jgi:hypothetical protein